VTTPADDGEAIFVNCPFDAAFEPLLDALLLAIVAYGFTPTSALSSGGLSEPRITRIFAGLREARYSIHDLSRCHGEGDANLARLNMPLELGMAMAISQGDPAAHTWAALVPEGKAYARFASDLAGFDLVRYSVGPSSLVLALGAWLAVLPGASPVYPSTVAGALAGFQAEVVRLRAGFGARPPWSHLVSTARALIDTVL
jgi:hypothetical protein